MHICSDCMAALTVPQNVTSESNLTPECHNMLNSHVMKLAVELPWGPENNEIRDNKIGNDAARLE